MTKDLKFPEYYELSIFDFYSLNSNAIDDIAYFMKNTNPKSISEFYFGNNSLTCSKIISTADAPSVPQLNKYIEFPLLEGITAFGRRATRRIYLQRLDIDSNGLKQILQAAHTCLEIDLIKCRIAVDDDFYIDPKIEFKTQVRLYWSSS